MCVCVWNCAHTLANGRDTARQRSGIRVPPRKAGRRQDPDIARTRVPCRRPRRTRNVKLPDQARDHVHSRGGSRRGFSDLSHGSAWPCAPTRQGTRPRTLLFDVARKTSKRSTAEETAFVRGDGLLGQPDGRSDLSFSRIQDGADAVHPGTSSSRQGMEIMPGGLSASAIRSGQEFGLDKGPSEGEGGVMLRPR